MSDDENPGPESLTPEAEHYVGAAIQGIWLQRTVESASKIVTAIHVQQEPFQERCELQLLTLQLSAIEFGASFQPVASIELAGFYLWLLEGDFVIFVDEAMNMRIWDWQSGYWGLIKDPTNQVMNAPVRHLSSKISTSMDIAESVL